jgi:homoaconitate hydratase
MNWRRILLKLMKALLCERIVLDLSAVEPFVFGPNTCKNYDPGFRIEAERSQIQKAYLVSWSTVRLNDIKEAAAVVEGKKVAEELNLYCGRFVKSRRKVKRLDIGRV